MEAPDALSSLGSFFFSAGGDRTSILFVGNSYLSNLKCLGHVVRYIRNYLDELP